MTATLNCLSVNPVPSTRRIGRQAVARAIRDGAMLVGHVLRHALHAGPLPAPPPGGSSARRAQPPGRGAGSPPPARRSPTPGPPAPLADERPPTPRRLEQSPPTASLAIARAQPRNAAPLASGTGPPQVGRLPETTAPPATDSEERTPRAHPLPGPREPDVGISP